MVETSELYALKYFTFIIFTTFVIVHHKYLKIITNFIHKPVVFCQDLN